MKKVVLTYGWGSFPELKEVSDELYERLKAADGSAAELYGLFPEVKNAIEGWHDYDPAEEMLLGYNFEHTAHIPAELFFRVVTESDNASFWSSGTCEELESVLGVDVTEVHTP